MSYSAHGPVPDSQIGAKRTFYFNLLVRGLYHESLKAHRLLNYEVGSCTQRVVSSVVSELSLLHEGLRQLWSSRTPLPARPIAMGSQEGWGQ